ncbi:MAG: ATP-binding protein, partial [Elusimicrobia bacterium]|nr:ATP-binding protein [Elusimicrobiota bacterium]
TRQMRQEDLARAVLASVGATWDEIPEERAGLSDLDWTKVREFRRLADKTGRRRIPERTSQLQFLRKLGLVRKEGVTRAAVLLFGKEPQAFYGEALVKGGRLRAVSLIVDDREIAGTLFAQVEGTMDYLRERLETRFERTGRPRREVIWEYPLDALREAVINAVCHRDYLSNGQTQVRIEDDRLVVMNPGGLPEGLSVAALKRRHDSIPRNRLIARMFYYAGFIERWGSGIGKMMDACRAALLPEPAFDAESGFKIVFSKARQKAAHVPHKYPTSIPPAAGSPPSSTSPVPHKRPTSTPQAAGERPTSAGPAPDQLRLVGFCAQPRTIKEMLGFMGLRDRVDFLRRHVQAMLAQGLLVMVSPDSPTSPKQKYRATMNGLCLLRGSG